MPTPAQANVRISAVSLQLTATLLGLVGTALVILQALFWIPKGRANLAVLIFTACVPVIAALFFALAPRRVEHQTVQSHAWHAPMVCVTLGLPLLLTILVMLLIGASGSFNNFSGLAMLLAANAGRNLREYVGSLMRRTTDPGPR